MYKLIQNEKNKTYLHGISDSVSELISNYYRYRKHFGYMEVVDSNSHVLATLGSKRVK